MVRDTNKIGEIAVQHHEKLQEKPEMTEERIRAIQKLEKIMEEKMISEEQSEMLRNKMSRKKVEEAIRSAASRTSPGVDGIPYELYKEIIKKERIKDKGIDIIGIIHEVINEMEEKRYKQRGMLCWGNCI